MQWVETIKDSRFEETMVAGKQGFSFPIYVLKRKHAKPTLKRKDVIESKGIKYTLEDSLGVGGMGEVWKARCLFPARPGSDDDVERDVAIKFIVGLDRDSQLKEKLIKEAQLIAQINHENIVGFEGWDYFPEKDAYYIVMEYIKGMDIDGLIKLHNLAPEKEIPQYFLNREENKIARIPDKITGFVLFCVGNALAYAHNKGVIHRDVSPGNILFKLDEGAIKLGDFGIAVTAEDLEGKEGKFISGKIPYISPEGVFDCKNVDARSDLYSLGVVAYQMLTGFRPNDIFKGVHSQLYRLDETLEKKLVPPHKIVRRIDRVLSGIVCKLLERDPKKRYQTAAELVDAVGRQYLFKGKYGPTKQGFRDYVKARHDPENTTKEILDNLSFLKRYWWSWDPEVFLPYVLTDWAEYKLKKEKKPENPARKEKHEKIR